MDVVQSSRLAQVTDAELFTVLVVLVPFEQQSIQNIHTTVLFTESIISI